MDEVVCKYCAGEGCTMCEGVGVRPNTKMVPPKVKILEPMKKTMDRLAKQLLEEVNGKRKKGH